MNFSSIWVSITGHFYPSRLSPRLEYHITTITGKSYHHEFVSPWCFIQSIDLLLPKYCFGTLILSCSLFVYVGQLSSIGFIFYSLGQHNFEFRSVSRFHESGSEARLISKSYFTNLPSFFIMRLHWIRILHFMCAWGWSEAGN